MNAIGELSGYRWTDAEHQIVFEAYSKMLSFHEKSFREMLPAQATRMGFPDVDWVLYFKPPRKAPAKIRNLVIALKQAARE